MITELMTCMAKDTPPDVVRDCRRILNFCESHLQMSPLRSTACCGLIAQCFKTVLQGRLDEEKPIWRRLSRFRIGWRRFGGL